MDTEILKRLYYEMLRIRRVEEKIGELYPEKEMRCPVHLCIGQEAIAVGVCQHLSGKDFVLSGHRSHGHYLAKGGSLKKMMAELYGKLDGCSGGKGGSMHLIDLATGFLGAVPIVGSTIPIAAGAAMGLAMQGEPRVVVAFFGEGATEEGVFHETLNFAALKKLPVIFVCENNLYSVYSSLSVRQPQMRNLSEIAKGHGITATYYGNGNDVIEVYNLADLAIKKARSGSGPAFLEFATYRWREHCGPYYDNDLGYRETSEYETWRQSCPIANLESRLINEDILNHQDIEGLQAKLVAEIEEATLFAKNSPFPEKSLLLSHIYASPIFI